MVCANCKISPYKRECAFCFPTCLLPAGRGVDIRPHLQRLLKPQGGLGNGSFARWYNKGTEAWVPMLDNLLPDFYMREKETFFLFKVLLFEVSIHWQPVLILSVRLACSNLFGCSQFCKIRAHLPSWELRSESRVW